jgi:aromatic ring-opening dioxygenase LigB subunit
VTVAFAAIAPHGWALIPSLCDDAAGARATQPAMIELGRRAREAGVDVIVVITPHGVRVDGACAIADVARGAGLLRWEGRQIEMNIAIDGALTAAIADDACAAGAPLVRVGFGGHSGVERVVPLDWGTMVPLWFLGWDRNQPGRGDVLADPPPADEDVGPPAVIVSPARGLPSEALIEVGRVIGRACERDPRRVAIVASCDWSHAHPSAVADRVERAVLDAIAADALGSLAALDPQTVDDAAVDGLWQALVLAGALEVAPIALDVLSYEAPPRYATGMIVAAGARGADSASPRRRSS